MTISFFTPTLGISNNENIKPTQRDNRIISLRWFWTIRPSQFRRALKDINWSEIVVGDWPPWTEHSCNTLIWLFPRGGGYIPVALTCTSIFPRNTTISRLSWKRNYQEWSWYHEQPNQSNSFEDNRFDVTERMAATIYESTTGSWTLVLYLILCIPWLVHENWMKTNVQR